MVTDLLQGGLSAILGSSSSPSQAQELTLRARCFYYSRKKTIPVDFDAYKAWREHIDAPPPSAPKSNSTSSPKSTSSVSSAAPAPLFTNGTSSPPVPPSEEVSGSVEEPAPYPQTFTDIVALITSGAPIPGIKDIPPTILHGHATQPASSRRKKPWEKDVAELPGVGDAEDEVAGAGTFGDVREEGTFGDRRDGIIPQVFPEV